MRARLQGQDAGPGLVLSRSRNVGRVCFVVGFGLYVAGLLLWLALGLVPYLARASPWFNHDLVHLAQGSSPVAHMARRLVDQAIATDPSGKVALQYLFSVMNLTLGIFLIVVRPRDRVAQLMALAMIGTAGTFNDPSHIVFKATGKMGVIQVAHFAFHLISGVAFVFAVWLFPDGRLIPTVTGRNRVRLRVAAGLGAWLITWLSWKGSFVSHPPFFVAFFGVLVPAIGVPAQTYRMHRAAAADRRQQSRLLRLALFPAAGAAVVWAAAFLVGAMAGGTPIGPGAERVHAAVQALFPAVFAAVPLMLAIGIFRSRLWDIDLVVNRTIVFTMLAGAIAGVYGIVVAFGGAAVGSSGWSTVVASTVIALAFEPTRARLQDLANRLVFGQRLAPEDVLASLADRLDHPGAGDELAQLAEVTALGLGATEVRVLVQHGHDREVVARWSRGQVASADSRASNMEVPIREHGEVIGALAARLPPGVAPRKIDTELLADLADRAGIAVQNAALRRELTRQLDRLAARADELRASRRQVVVTRDTERRRLERNIHDGAQQDLIVLVVQFKLAATTDPSSLTRATIEALRQCAESTLASLGQITSGLYPDRLAVDGLAPALRAAVARTSGLGVSIEVRSTVSRRLQSEIEAAVYFSCLEAIQNSIKHAQGTGIDVELHTDAQGVLCFTVRDNGNGFELERHAAGSGLTNMADRLSAVGGVLTVSSRVGEGTTVSGRIDTHEPVPA